MPSASIRIRGDVKEALAALEALGVKAEQTGVKAEKAFGDKFAGSADRAANSFQKLGSALSSVPVLGSSFSKAGDKIAEADTKGKKFFSTLSEVGKVSLMAGAAGLAAAGVESVKLAGNFQSAATHLVTDAGLSAGALAQVEKGMLAVSSATGTSATDIVNGMYHVQSGLHLGAAGLGVLRTAAEGAKVGNADLDTVSKTLTGTLASYYGETINASNATKLSTQMMNELIATVGAGDMRMEDLASSLGNVTPLAAAAGLSFAQVGGAIATMTSQNMTAQQATQDLANLIRNLQKPNQVAVTAMAQMGLNANTVSKQLGKNGLTGTLSTLTKAITDHMGPAGMVVQDAFNQSVGAAQNMQVELSKMPATSKQVAEAFMSGKMTLFQFRQEMKAMPANQQALLQGFVQTYNQAHKFNQLLTSGSPAAQTFTAELAKMTGGATGLNTSLMLTGNNMPVFVNNVNTIGDAASKTGAHVDNWNTIQKTFNQEVDQAKVTVENLGISFGTWLIPKLQQAAQVGAQAINWLHNHKAAAEALAYTIGGTLSLAVGAFTVNKLAGMVKGIAQAVSTLANLGQMAVNVAAKVLGLGAAEATAGSEAAAATAEEGAFAASEGAAGTAAAAATPEVAGLGVAATTAATGLGAVAAGLGIDYLGNKAIQKWGTVNGPLGTPDATSPGGYLGAYAGQQGWTPQQMGEYMSLVGSGQKISPQQFNASLKAGPGAPQTSNAAPTFVPGQGWVMSGTPTQAVVPGHRAGGGSVLANMPYIVGELGPELFMPHTSGTVVPHHAVGAVMGGAGGGTTVVIENLTLPGVQTPDQFANQMAQRARIDALAGGSARRL